MGVEHLLNCEKSTLFSNMCFDHDMNHLAQSFLSDMIGSIASIGFMVASYFYFKRITEKQSTERMEDETIPSIRECPKCNGTGYNLFNRQILCDLCDGSGFIDFPRPQSYSLPFPRRNEDIE
jgi:hypothetical protein